MCRRVRFSGFSWGGLESGAFDFLAVCRFSRERGLARSRYVLTLVFGRFSSVVVVSMVRGRFRVNAGNRGRFVDS